MHKQKDTSSAAARWRIPWILIVLAALAAGPLTVVLAQVRQKANDAATFRKLVDELCAAWSTGDPDKPAVFYAKDADLVFYDVTPFQYRGWKEYHDGVKREILDKMASGKLTAEKDLRVTRRGNLAWSTVSMHFSETLKDGKTMEMELRETAIWERRGGKWLIVHEHVSAPLS